MGDASATSGSGCDLICHAQKMYCVLLNKLPLDKKISKAFQGERFPHIKKVCFYKSIFKRYHLVITCMLEQRCIIRHLISSDISYLSHESENNTVLLLRTLLSLPCNLINT